MKTKFSFLLAIIFIMSALLVSCANTNATSTQETTNSLNNIGASHRYTYFYSMDELLDDINDSEKKNTKVQEFYQKIRDTGKLYYPEIKFDEYLIDGMEISGMGLTYELYPKEAFTGDRNDLYMALEDLFRICIEYGEPFESKKSRLLEDEDFVLLENGSLYSEKLKWIIFEFEGYGYQLNLSENYTGSLDWQDIIEIKYIEVK